MRHGLLGAAVLAGLWAAASPAEAHHKGRYDPYCAYPGGYYVVPPPRYYAPPPVYYYAPPPPRRHYYAPPATYWPRRDHYAPRGAATFYFRF